MPGEERTESPTPQRRQELRQQGQIPRSTEIQTAAIVLAAFAGLRLAGGEMLDRLQGVTRNALGGAAGGPAGLEGLYEQATSWVGAGLVLALPLLAGLWAVGLAVASIQSGFLLSTRPLEPDLGRLNPLKGFGRMFSPAALVELAKACIKLGIVGWGMWLLLQERAGDLVALSHSSVPGGAGLVADLGLELGTRSALLFAVLAAIDYGYQRWTYERRIRMTKQEVRDSLKQTEGDPRVKARIREMGRRYARSRMLQQVPRATVVVVNPVHLAVALMYRPGETEAPAVVAKGQRLMAQRIREIAARHRVPVIEHPPLAWALHRGAEVGDRIPAALYQAVAEVLAFVFSTGPGRAATVFHPREPVPETRLRAMREHPEEEEG